MGSGTWRPWPFSLWGLCVSCPFAAPLLPLTGCAAGCILLAADPHPGPSRWLLFPSRLLSRLAPSQPFVSHQLTAVSSRLGWAESAA